MKIGELELELTKPENLDAQLVQLTGCTAEEIHAHMASAAIADHVGAALLPFVKDAPPRQVLAQAIARDGVVHVRRAVRKLYADALGIAPDPLLDEEMPKKEPRRGAKQKG